MTAKFGNGNKWDNESNMGQWRQYGTMEARLPTGTMEAIWDNGGKMRQWKQAYQHVLEHQNIPDLVLRIGKHTFSNTLPTLLQFGTGVRSLGTDAKHQLSQAQMEGETVYQDFFLFWQHNSHEWV